MGSACGCSRDSVIPNTEPRGITNEDEHDVLCIKILQAKRLVSGNFIPSKPNELTAYVQLTYGNFDKVPNPPATDYGPDSLHRHMKGCHTRITKSSQTYKQGCVFNQTIYFPIHNIHSKRSLEISLWDKNISVNKTETETSTSRSYRDQKNDEMKGKAFIYHLKHSKISEMKSNPKLKRKKSKIYQLPSKWGEYNKYSVRLTNDTSGKVTGVLDIELRFRKKHANDGWKDEAFAGSGVVVDDSDYDYDDDLTATETETATASSTTTYNEQAPMLK